MREGRVRGDLRPQQRPIHRGSSSTSNQQCQRYSEQDQRKLHPSFTGKEGMPVNQQNRHRHRDRIQSCSNTRQRSESQHQPAEKLGRPSRERPKDPGDQTQALLEETTGPGEPVAPKPAKKFLGAMSRERESGCQPQRKKSKSATRCQQFVDVVIFHIRVHVELRWTTIPVLKRIEKYYDACLRIPERYGRS
jgi:hypothetical protein